MDPDGTNVQVLTSFSAPIDWVFWSPDGTEIWFTEFKFIGSNLNDIFKVNVATQVVTPITSDSIFFRDPSFYPDGSKILFAKAAVSGASPTAVVSMNPDGTGQMELHSGNIGRASVSPDNTKIAFRLFDGDADLYVMNLDGTNPQEIFTTGGGGGIQDPNWGTFPDTAPEVDLSVTKTVSDTNPNPGNTITYTITAINNGPSDATGVKITDALPAGVTIDVGTPPSATLGTYTAPDWDIGTLTVAAGTVTLTITAIVDAGTEGNIITNTAQLSLIDLDQTDTDPTNDSDSADLVVSPVNPPDKVSWWRAENNALDSVGGNDGTLRNGATFAAGEVGQAFSFDGINDDVFIPASGNLDVGLSSGFTIEVWVNPNDANTQPFVEWNNGIGGGPGTHQNLGVHLWQSFTPGSLFSNIVDNTGVPHHINSPDGIMIPGQFQHVAVTYDKTTGNFYQR